MIADDDTIFVRHTNEYKVGHIIANKYVLIYWCEVMIYFNH